MLLQYGKIQIWNGSRDIHMGNTGSKDFFSGRRRRGQLLDHGFACSCHQVAIDNQGRWPNLTKLPNRELAAAVYNHPSHGYGDNSDVELWISADGGVSWKFRSRISSHPEEPDGKWLAVCRTSCRDRMDRALPHGSGETLTRSRDQGKTWSEPKLISLQQLAENRRRLSFERATRRGLDRDRVLLRAQAAQIRRRLPPLAPALPHGRYHMGVAKWDMSMWPDDA